MECGRESYATIHVGTTRVSDTVVTTLRSAQCAMELLEEQAQILDEGRVCIICCNH